MPKTALQTIFFAIRNERPRVAAIWFLIFVGNSISLTLPAFLKLIADYAVETQADAFDPADITFPLAAVVLVLLTQEVLFRTAHYLETVLNIRVYCSVTSYYYNNLLHRPSSYFENTFSGKLSRRIEQISASIKYFLESFPWEFGWMVPAILVSSLLLFIGHPLLFLGYLVWLLLFLGISVPLLTRLYAESKQVAESGASLDGGIVDTLSNVNLVHSFAAEKTENARLQRGLSSLSEIFMREGKWFILNKLHQGLSAALLSGMLVFISIHLFSRNQITVGDFLLVAATIPSLTNVIWMMGDTIVRSIRQYGNLSDAVADLQTDVEYLAEGNDVLNVVESKIQFHQVSFTYPGSVKPVFADFNLTIQAGERVGFVGSSGAGKSTLIKLLLRQYDPTNGTISIASKDIRAISVESLRNVISFVPQDTTLFHRSLFDNIQYAKPDATLDEVIEASKRAHAHEFIQALPQQYDTTVGERGVRLSGGQRQRIAIARAMLKDAPILVLDEATSALDSESEEIVQRGLRELFAGRTVMAVAHRLSTLREMTRIVVIENGKIIEDGNPEDLLRNDNGAFKNLWEHQKGGFVT